MMNKSEQQHGTGRARLILGALQLCVFLGSLCGSSVYPSEMCSAQGRQPEYTHAQPYLFPMGAPELRGRQTGDHIRPVDVLAPEHVHASPVRLGALVGGVILGIDPPVVAHLVSTQLTASGL